MVLAEAVGVFLELLRAVSVMKDKAAKFKQTLVNLETTLIAIAPAMYDIERLNNELGRPKEELQGLITKMEQGKTLVNECSNIHWLNCVARSRYQKQLKELQDSFLNLLTLVMLVQMIRDQKDLRLQILNSSSDSNHIVFPYMLTARNLSIAWVDTPRYWRWTSVSETRFPEVAELVAVCWLDIRGWINTSMLSPNTLYGAYLVFTQSSGGSQGFKNRAVDVWAKVAGEDDRIRRRAVYLVAATPPQSTRFRDSSDAATLSLLAEPSELEVGYPNGRADGWMEVELGAFSRTQVDKVVEMAVCEIHSGIWKAGILVRGIEIRPK